jgi:hypothetical protein
MVMQVTIVLLNVTMCELLDLTLFHEHETKCNQ